MRGQASGSRRPVQYPEALRSQGRCYITSGIVCCMGAVFLFVLYATMDAISVVPSIVVAAWGVTCLLSGWWRFRIAKKMAEIENQENGELPAVAPREDYPPYHPVPTLPQARTEALVQSSGSGGDQPFSVPPERYAQSASTCPTMSPAEDLPPSYEEVAKT